MNVYEIYTRKGKSGTWHKEGQVRASSVAAAIKQWPREKGRTRRAQLVHKGNPGRLTKTQRKARTKKLSAKRRVANALKAYLQKANPGKRLAGAKVEQFKGGAVKITPVLLNPGSSVRWGVKTWQGTVGAWARKSDATAYAKRLREANKQAGNRGSVKVVKVSS